MTEIVAKSSRKLVRVAKNPEKMRDSRVGTLTGVCPALTFAVTIAYGFPYFLRRRHMAKANGGAGGGKAKSMTKSQIYDAVAQESEFSRSDVKKFFAALESVVTDQLGKKGPGVVTIPGLIKLTAVKKPATKGGEQRPNPFKPGEFIITKPKPAQTKVKARALKAFTEALK